MHEIDRIAPEFQSQTPAQSTLELVETLHDPATIERFQYGWNAELEDTAMQHVAKLEDRAAQLHSKLVSLDGDARAQWDLSDKIDKIRDILRRTFGKDYVRFQDIRAMQANLERSGAKKLSIHGEGAREMAEYFTSKAETIDPPEQQFVDGDYLKALAEEPILTTHIRDDEPPIEIPLSSIVSAEGFESWEGRGYQESSDKIADFASRDTEIPPVNELYAYVLPDGKVMYKIANSHRVAAAIKKGQQTIGFKGSLTVSKLKSVPYGLETESAGREQQKNETMNGNSIEHPREKMDVDEFREMLGQYGLSGASPSERAKELSQMNAQTIALMLGDINKRLQGSEETLIDSSVVKIGDSETVKPEARYDIFTEMVDQIRNADEDVSPERIGDTLALGLVLLHPFKDGNGRTARLVGSIFREAFDDPEEMNSDYSVLVTSRDELREKGVFMPNGYVPQAISGDYQSDPETVKNYIQDLLNSDDVGLYTGPYGQAPLRK